MRACSQRECATDGPGIGTLDERRAADRCTCVDPSVRSLALRRDC
jgi:hypothetical protein